jgi:glucose-1-phosphate adenylyltransferase
MAMVLAGGRGRRLFPLTGHRSKPAVPFGGTCRLIDFALSNLVNSGVSQIYVLTQYKSHSLQRHLQQGWTLTHPMNGYLLMPVPPQMMGRETWYLGTADAVYQNIGLIRNKNPDLVLVFGSDHVYSMDVGAMIQYHLEKNADLTVASIPMAVTHCSPFGTLGVDGDSRVLSFEEKAESPPAFPERPGQALVSMGNYVFNADVLREELEADGARRGSTHDFGRDILPEICARRRVYAYDFRMNQLPGVNGASAYWRDVGTIESYYLSNMDLIDPLSRLNLNNPLWPIRSVNYNGMPLKLTESLSGRPGCIENSIVGGSVVVAGGYVRNSILGNNVFIGPDAEVKDSVILGNTVIKEGARVLRAVIDHGNVVGKKEDIGFDRESDASRFFLDGSGIVVLPHRHDDLFYLNLTKGD